MQINLLKNRMAVFILVLLFLWSPAWAEDKPFAFVAIGDSGCGCGGQRLVSQRMYSWWQKYPYYAVIMLGDNIYSGKNGRGGSPLLFSDRFDEMYKPLLMSGVKFYATLGNHDLETNGGGYEIADKARFHIAQDTGYYSFQSDQQANGRPLIEFFSLNSNRLLSLNADPAQIAWLSKALSESKAIWKIAFFHHPIYSPEGPHSPEKGLRQGIEKILIAAGVQLILSGHDHYYARMNPQHGIVQMISGGGGQDLKTPRANEFTAKAYKLFHFMYFEVFPERIEFSAVPATGVPFDSGSFRLSPTPPTSGIGK